MQKIKQLVYYGKRIKNFIDPSSFIAKNLGLTKDDVQRMSYLDRDRLEKAIRVAVNNKHPMNKVAQKTIQQVLDHYKF